MGRQDLVEISGKLVSALGGGQYSIETDGGAVIRAQLCGKMRKQRIMVLPGDKVTVSVSPYDLTHGIITWRFK